MPKPSTDMHSTIIKIVKHSDGVYEYIDPHEIVKVIKQKHITKVHVYFCTKCKEVDCHHSYCVQEAINYEEV